MRETGRNPHPQNPKGSFENREVGSLMNLVWTDIEHGLSIEDAHLRYHFDIQKILTDIDGDWGFKVGLAHKGIELYIPHFPNMHMVIVTRNPMHNALSWQIHMKDVYGTNVSFDYAMQRVSRFVTDMIEVIHGIDCPKAWVTYEDIKKDPVREANKLASFLGYEMTASQEQGVKEFILKEYSTLHPSPPTT